MKCFSLPAPTLRGLGLVSVLLLTAGMLSGCSLFSKTTTTDPNVSMTIIGTADMNGGNAAQVRIVQLQSDTRFRDASFEAFWEDPAQELDDDLVAEEGFLLYPNGSEARDLMLDEQTRFIGVAVDLREPEGNDWRLVQPVDVLRGQRVRVTVGDRSVEIQAL